VGTSGPGAFDNDEALDLLDALTRQEVDQRRQSLERVFRQAMEHPEDVGGSLGSSRIVAAAAVVAAGLEPNEAVMADIAEWGYDAAEIVIMASHPALARSALAALLIAAGRDGAWHQGWVHAEDALQARHTTDQLASVLYRHQHTA
jgi:hypothetical protein